jgi:hypothetical protein
MILAKIEEENKFREKKMSRQNKFNNHNSNAYYDDENNKRAKEATVHNGYVDEPNTKLVTEIPNSGSNNCLDDGSSSASSSSKVDLNLNAESLSSITTSSVTYKNPDIIDIEPYLDQEKSVNVYCTAVAHPHAFWVT